MSDFDKASSSFVGLALVYGVAWLVRFTIDTQGRGAGMMVGIAAILVLYSPWIIIAMFRDLRRAK